MPRLILSLRAWSSDAFARTLKDEIESLGAGALPLDRTTTHGGRADDGPITATVLRASDDGDAIQAEVGIFFGEILAGCSCGDEAQILNAYGELRVSIDKATAEAAFAPS